MEVKYNIERNKRTMIIGAEERRWSEYETQMFNYNCIRGLLKFYVLVQDGKISFVYDISGMEPVSEHIRKHGMTRQEFGLFVIGMRRALRGVEDYMLNEKALVLSPDYIFVDKDCRKFKFCYVPGSGCSENGGFRDMIKQVLALIIKKDGMVSPWISSLATTLEKEGFKVTDMELDGLRINIPVKTETDIEPEDMDDAEVSRLGARRLRLRSERRVDSRERSGRMHMRKENRVSRAAERGIRMGFRSERYADIFD